VQPNTGANIPHVKQVLAALSQTEHTAASWHRAAKYLSEMRSAIRTGNHRVVDQIIQSLEDLGRQRVVPTWRATQKGPEVNRHVTRSLPPPRIRDLINVTVQSLTEVSHASIPEKPKPDEAR
jgi:hypothetical protein